MRQLNPSRAHEKFVASGVYTFYVQDQPVGIVEYWSIHELPDGAQLIRVDMDGRSSTLARVKARDTLIEAWRSPPQEGGRIRRFDVRVYGLKDDEVKFARVNISVETSHIHIASTLDNRPSQHKEFKFLSNGVVLGGSALFIGFATAEVAQQDGAEVPVFTYSTPLAHADNAIIADIHISSQKSPVGEDTLTIAGKSILACRFQSGPEIGGDDYLPGTIEWLDSYDTLLQSDNGRGGVIRLTQYARRPEPKS